MQAWLLGLGSLASAAAQEVAMLGDGDSSGSGSAADSGTYSVKIEQRIIAVLASLGAVLILISAAMMSASGSAVAATEEIGDHAQGAVDALLDRTEAQERRESFTQAQRLERQRIRAALLDEFPVYDPLDIDARVAEQQKIDYFFERRVTDDWLIDRLHAVGYTVNGEVFNRKTRCPFCVDWKALWLRHIHASDAQEREYGRMRERLRGYIAKNLYISGRLEPFWDQPAAQAVVRLCKSVVAVFDFATDVLACHSMYVGVDSSARPEDQEDHDPGAQQSLAVVAIVWLVFSTVLSTVGTCYFTFKATERVHAEAEPHRIADQEMLESKPRKYCIVLFASMTNPELLHHMPWYNLNLCQHPAWLLLWTVTCSMCVYYSHWWSVSQAEPKSDG